MRISSLSNLAADQTELGVVYASVEGVNEHSYEECLHELKEKGKALGAKREEQEARHGNTSIVQR